MSVPKNLFRLTWIPLVATAATLGTPLRSGLVVAQTLQIQSQQRPCVLLKNDNVLFGDAHQLGEFVVVRTGPNDELRLPRSEVACWASSLTDLYRYRLDHRSKHGFESHLADARWCLQYDLLDQAAAEIRSARALAPNHPTIGLLESQLDRRSETAESLLIQRPAVAQADFRRDMDVPDRGEANRADPATLSEFASHVQPTLINRCGRCHDQKSPTQWRLTLPAAGTRATARMTRENLAASLRFVDRADSQQSVLLLKATSPHGGDDAPLGPRNATAVVALKRWLFHTAESTAQRAAKELDSGSAASTTETDRAFWHGGLSPPELDDVEAVATVSYTTSAESSIDEDQPKRLPTVANPLDPSLFNRRYHRQAP